MNTNKHEYDRSLEFKEETHQIIGSAMDVLNALGHGFPEKTYENAIIVEFGLKNIPFSQQARFPLVYKNVKVGEFIPDLIVFDNIIVELKTTPAITDLERGQVLNYLKAAKAKIGLILNFARPKLEWERLVL